MFTAKLFGKYSEFSYTPIPTHVQPPPTMNICTMMVCLLQSMNIH